MGRKKTTADKSGYILVNVVYEDGSQRSNRRVPESDITGFDDKGDILKSIEDQDQKIAEMSGQARAPIASIKRVRKR